VNTYSLGHLADGTLKRDLAAHVASERTATAVVLAHIAEFDARRLYVPAGYPSMFAYCVGELHLSEEAAFKRIHAARAARRFPAIFSAVAEGRLHLSAVILLAPHLTAETGGELLAAAEHKTKVEIEQLLANRFPRPDLPTRLEPLPSRLSTAGQHAPGRVELSVPAPIEPLPPPRVTPLAPERFALQFTMSQSTHDKLRHAQALLGHQVASGDIAEVFDRALDALIVQLEKRKLGATSRPPSGQRRTCTNPRYIPAQVRRAVWAGDGGRCTFVGQNGHRCEARSRLEFDHIREVARGGEATATNIRLRCRAHNQYEAERTFGAEFMRHKREEARSPAATLA